MHQQTDTDDLSGDYKLLGINTEYLLPANPIAVQVVAYNPFKYIPLSRLNRVVYTRQAAPPTRFPSSTFDRMWLRRNPSINSGTSRHSYLGPGIPITSPLVWIDGSLNKCGDSKQFEREAKPVKEEPKERYFVSRGTMTRRIDMAAASSQGPARPAVASDAKRRKLMKCSNTSSTSQSNDKPERKPKKQLSFVLYYAKWPLFCQVEILIYTITICNFRIFDWFDHLIIVCKYAHIVR